jgi:uncharacterized 2Fe-2S/4Fe-4S cluster protein (DUF4445 family)
VEHAIACGLLPGFKTGQIEIVGNTALGGAWLALVDRTILPEMSAAALGAESMELNLDPRFEDTFIDQLALPGGAAEAGMPSIIATNATEQEVGKASRRFFPTCNIAGFPPGPPGSNLHSTLP